MKGLRNSILVADAETGGCSVVSVPEEVLLRGWGGKGLGTHLLAQYSLVGVDPLAPENPVVFTVGPVTDTRIPGSCRYGVFTKSPQTGFYAESYSGGKLAEKISRSGFDAVVLTGASAEPVYLEVSEDGGRFHPAGDLWGHDTYVAEEALLSRYGGPARAGAAVIGPGGERGIPFSIIANDRWRCAGRTGTGAVLGSKQIKGLVFHGATPREVADPEGVEGFARRIVQEKKDHAATQAYRNFGTPMMVALLNSVNAFPSGYWRRGHLPAFENISAEAMNERCDVRPKACPRCFMACGKLTRIRQGRHAGLEIEGPEYETIYAFGGLCGIPSIEEIAHLNDVCDRLGLDTITAGNLVAFAMEAVRLGVLPKGPRYGDVTAAEQLLQDIVQKRGLGETLASGLASAAHEWGLEDVAIHVKGLEPAGYDPRVLKGMGLAYATSDRGACHLRTTFYKPELSGQIAADSVDGKAELFVDYEDRATLFDGLILCRFFRDFYQWEQLSEIVAITMGERLGKRELQSVACHITDEVRRFNLREGLTKDDDWLPDRFFDEPLPETGAVLQRKELERMRADYYRLRGWSEDGRPAVS